MKRRSMECRRRAGSKRQGDSGRQRHRSRRSTERNLLGEERIPDACRRQRSCGRTFRTHARPAPGHEGIRCWYPTTRTGAGADAPSANAKLTSSESRGGPELQTASSSPPARMGTESADSATEARMAHASPEGAKPPAAASGYDPTCLPSPSAVRQSYPQARPSWTLRVPGHEGTKCWYAAT